MRAEIRDATPDDIPVLLDMGRRFVEQAWADTGIPFCSESCSALLNHLIDSETGILLVAGACEGMLGALVYPWHFNRSVLTGQELFWWAESGSRCGASLLDEAERRVAALGASTFNMAAIDKMRGPALARFYAARGYRPSEHIYIRGL